jgi:hypothetical protein
MRKNEESQVDEPEEAFLEKRTDTLEVPGLNFAGRADC